MKKITLLLSSLLFSASAFAGALFSSDGQFIVPDGVYRIDVVVAGGNGGRGATCSNRWRGRGWPGGSRNTVVAVWPGEVINVYVGQGGIGTCGGGGGGGGGGASVYGADFNLWANGGAGGWGTGGGCAFCGENGGNAFVAINW